MNLTTTSRPGSDGDTGAVPEVYRSGRAKALRRRRVRLLAYGAGLALVAGFASVADWSTIADAYLDVERARALLPDVVTIAAKNTVIYSRFSFVGGAVLGLARALLRLSAIRPDRGFASSDIEIFRGLPALLTIILVGFITPIALGVSFPQILGVPTAGIVALSLVAGAYLAETIRAGIEAVPAGQVEAARSLGLSDGQALRRVVIPQAFRIVIPPLTNELVLLLKDTSLLSVLGVTVTSKELTKFGQDAANQGFNGTPLLVAGLMYLMITIPLTRLVAVLERRNRASA